jgi:hypothetical protein
MAAMMLTRPDGAIPCLVIGVWLVVVLPRPQRQAVVLRVLGLVVLVVAAQTAFRLAYYGSALPNTYYLKVEGISLVDRLDRGLSSFGDLFRLHLWAPVALVGLLFLTRASRPTRKESLLIGMFVLPCVYSIYLGGDAWEWMNYSNRYITPGAVALLVLVAVRAADIPDLIRSAAARTLVVASFLLLAVTAANVLIARNHGVAFPKLPTLLPVALLVLLAASGIMLSRWPTRLASVASVAAFGALLFVSTNGVPLHTWRDANAYDLVGNKEHVEYALDVREGTSPDARIAVLMAGTIPYFAERPAVDLFGKSDAVVARSRPSLPFYPGHNKYVPEYSFGRLRPDLVLQGATDPPLMRKWGYRLLKGSSTVWVRRGTRAVDRAQLVRSLSTAG